MLQLVDFLPQPHLGSSLLFKFSPALVGLRFGFCLSLGLLLQLNVQALHLLHQPGHVYLCVNSLLPHCVHLLPCVSKFFIKEPATLLISTMVSSQSLDLLDQLGVLLVQKLDAVQVGLQALVEIQHLLFLTSKAVDGRVDGSL